MKRSIRLAVAASMISAFACNAHAADSSDQYVGLGLGAFNLDNGVNSKMTAGSYLQLGHNFMDNLGAEIRVGLTGTTGEELTLQPRMKIKSFMAAYLKPQYQLDSQWTAYGLLGVANINGTYSVGVSPKQNKSRAGISYGLGMQYNVSEMYSISAEAAQMLTKPKATAATVKTNFNGLSASAFSINAQYHF